MTRINLVDPSELSRLHLIAEYKEIARLPNNLKKSLQRKSKPFSMSEIPPEYVLGSGHVKYFYDKMLFLEKRFNSLVEEVLKRGYNPSFREGTIFRDCPDYFYNDYTPSDKDIMLNKQRIQERSKK